MLPVPKHLQHILEPIGDSNNEFEITGKIVCNCGSENFTIELVGDTSNYQNNRVIKVIKIVENSNFIVKVCHFLPRFTLLNNYPSIIPKYFSKCFFTAVATSK
jgi:hypothetical protein